MNIYEQKKKVQELMRACEKEDSIDNQYELSRQLIILNESEPVPNLDNVRRKYGLNTAIWSLAEAKLLEERKAEVTRGEVEGNIEILCGMLKCEQTSYASEVAKQMKFVLALLKKYLKLNAAEITDCMIEASQVKYHELVMPLVFAQLRLETVTESKNAMKTAFVLQKMIVAKFNMQPELLKSAYEAAEVKYKTHFKEEK